MTEEKPRKVPRFVSCLVKGPLGCLAFVLGVLVVLVLFLPSALGRWADRSLEGWFASHHEGSLQLADVWLGSLYAEQRIESMILRDPGGDEVLRASLRAPALWGFLGEDEVRYGPVEIHVNTLRLVEQEGGSLNLVRAWRERAGDERREPERESRENGLRTDVPVIVDLVLTVERLRLLDRRGAETQLADISLQGSLELNNDDLRLVLEGGVEPARPDALHLRIELERLDGRAGVAWKNSWKVERLPTPLAEHLLVPRLALAGLAGPVVDQVHWSRQGSRLALELEDGEAKFSLEGNLSEDGQALEGDEDDPAKLSFPLQNPAAAAAVAAFLPFVRVLDSGPEAEVKARLGDFRWPLAGGWQGLSGDMELDLDDAHFELDPALQAHLAGMALRPVQGKLEHSLRVEEGRAEFTGFRLPLEDGWLALEGYCDLVSRRCELAVLAEVAGEAHDLGYWSGDPLALAPSPPLPPEPLEAPEELHDEPSDDLPEDR